MIASPLRRGETLGSRHGATTDLSHCDNLVEQREYGSMTSHVIDVNDCGGAEMRA